MVTGHTFRPMNPVTDKRGVAGGGESSPSRAWLLPTLLLLHAAVPALGGVYRVVSVTLGGEVTPANARFHGDPAPVVLHGIACAVFAGTGAFQFSGPRGRWHRLRGRLFVPSALIVALTGLWMEATYALPAHDGALLSALRALFGTAMVGTTLMGVRAVLLRDFAAHGAWMMRTYAIGMGAGTQVLVFLPWALLVGEVTVTGRALLMGAGWAINVAVVEWVLARRRARPVASLLPSR